MPYKLSDKQREYQRLHVKKRRVERTKFLLAGKVCERCGFDNIMALEFHHRNPEEKKFTVMNSLTKPLKEILDEISKCDLLCANCHTIEHRIREQGKWKEIYKDASIGQFA